MIIILIYDQAGIISQIYDSSINSLNQITKKSMKVNIPKERICLNEAEKEDLGRMSTENEIKNVVLSFQPFKDPGPDGLHPFFYQKYWDILN